MFHHVSWLTYRCYIIFLWGLKCLRTNQISVKKAINLKINVSWTLLVKRDKLQRNRASMNTFICHQDYVKYNRMFQYDSLGIISGTYNVGKRSGNLVRSAAICVVQILIRQGEKANYHLIKSAGEVVGGKRL